MTHLARIAGALAVSLAAIPACAAEQAARAQASATVVEPMAVRMQWATAMPTVRGSTDGAVFAGRMPSMAMGMMMPANARLMIRREDETGGPVTAPGAFQIVAPRATDGLVVRTGLTADVRLIGGDVLVGGALQGRSAASIGVGRGFVLASTGAPALTAPATLVVLVQYN